MDVAQFRQDSGSSEDRGNHAMETRRGRGLDQGWGAAALQMGLGRERKTVNRLWREANEKSEMAVALL